MGTDPNVIIWGLIGSGVLMLIFGGKMLARADRYEFENRTDGGVVRFESYEASNTHEAKKSLGKLLCVVGFVFLIFGIMAFVNN
jgi:hypothetical protein